MDARSVIEKSGDAAQGMSFMTGENIAYLMGLSFVIGSLFTIFILVLLDFMKRDRGIDR